MTQDEHQNDKATKENRIKDAAQRALEEAAARKASETDSSQMATEKGGQDGPEPTRFGDWEKGGLISDF